MDLELWRQVGAVSDGKSSWIFTNQYQYRNSDFQPRERRFRNAGQRRRRGHDPRPRTGARHAVPAPPRERAAAARDSAQRRRDRDRLGARSHAVRRYHRYHRDARSRRGDGCLDATHERNPVRRSGRFDDANEPAPRTGRRRTGAADPDDPGHPVQARRHLDSRCGMAGDVAREPVRPEGAGTASRGHA